MSNKTNLVLVINKTKEAIHPKVEDTSIPKGADGKVGVTTIQIMPQGRVHLSATQTLQKRWMELNGSTVIVNAPKVENTVVTVKDEPSEAETSAEATAEENSKETTATDGSTDKEG